MTLRNAFAIVLTQLPIIGACVKRGGQWTGIELYQNIETKNRVLGTFKQVAAESQKACQLVAKTIAAIFVVATVLHVSPALAGQVKSLKFYHLHTHEKATIVFKRNGRYDPAGLKKINSILRDWRENEPTRMDPRLLDLIWEVYQKSGSNDYINVICGYRAPETNSMLRSRSRGVAEKSQHVLGKALDFYIPGVPLKKLREIGVKFQVGGVGFYPTSGSPFVHMDVGGVRAWPRMPRRELARLFPDGKTLHKPAEGGTMPGYAAALADYKRRVGGDSILVAGGSSRNSDKDTGRRRSLLAALFSTGDENEEEIVESPRQVQEAGPARSRKNDTKQETILTASAESDEAIINAPVPRNRPAYTSDQPAVETALLSTQKNPAEEAMQAALTPRPEDVAKAEPEFTNLASMHVPVPQLLARKRPGDADGIMTASLDSSTEISAVPVPADRPEEVTVASADPEPVDVAEADIKPSEVAALAAETGGVQKDESTDEDEVAGIIDSLDSADKGDAKSNLAEMASLEVPTGNVTRSFKMPEGATFGDVMAEDDHKVIKGGRPKRSDVKANADSVRAEPKLTQNLIAQWALTNGRAQIIAKPVKAPRFVSHTMRMQPTEVYAEGFSVDTAQVDPARFSGTAVNFLAVKKFDTED